MVHVAHSPDDHTRGSALLIVLLMTFLFAAIVMGGTVFVRVDALVADRYGRTVSALHGAEAGLDVAVSELRRIDDWTAIVAGAQRSRRAVGAFAGNAAVPDAPPVAL